MASIAIGAAFAAVGYGLGGMAGYAALGASIGWAVGSYIGKAYFGPEGPDTTSVGPRLDQLAVQSSTYSEPIPKVFGSVRLAGNVIWSSGLQEHRHEETQEGGKGFGGGGSATQVWYSYDCSFAVGICQGEIAGVRRIWADSKLMFERGDNAAPTLDSIQNEGADSITVYSGTETQEPDPVIESYEGDGNVPAYRGLAYIVFENLKLGDYGNRLPNIEVEVATGLEEIILYFSEWMNYAYYAHDSGFWTFDTEFGPDELRLFDSVGPGNKKVLEVLDCADDLASYHNIVDDFGDGCYILNKIGRYSDVCIYDGMTGSKINTMNGDTLTGATTWDNLDGIDFYYNTNVSSIMEIATCYLSNFNYARDYKYHIELFPYNHELHRPSFEGKTTPTGIMLLDVTEDGKWGYRELPSYRRLSGNNDLIVHRMVAYNGKFYIQVMDENANWDIGHAHKLMVFSWNNPIPEQVINLTDENDSEFPILDDYDDWIHISPFGDLVIQHNYDQIYVADGISNILKRVYTYSSGEVSPVKLDQIVGYLFQEAGLDSNQYDVSELTNDDVIGFSLTDVMTTEAALQSLMSTYQFDIVEVDWVLKCKKRGNSPQIDIPEDDLDAREYGQNQEETIKVSRVQEKELPKEMLFNYMDIDIDYQKNVQMTTRQNQIVDTTHTDKRTVPIVMNGTQALRAVESLFQTVWTARESYEFSVPADYIDLVPGSVVTLMNGQYTAHINQLTLSMPGLLQIKATREYNASYKSDSIAEKSHVTPSEMTVLQKSFSKFFDIPSLSSLRQNAGLYVGAYGLKKGYPGAAFLKSIDEGQTWNQIGYVTEPIIVGKTKETLSDGPVAIWDRVNTLNVGLLTPDSSLSGTTELSATKGTNSALVGSHGRWEIISFVNVVEESDGTFTLSNLIRGRRGTERNTSNHTSDDDFILIEPSKMSFVPIVEDNIETALDYKAVTSGQLIQNAGVKSFTCIGETLKPFSPVHLYGERNASGDITISWIRRYRGSDTWSGKLSIGEDTEEYEVDIFDGTTVVRTITVTDQMETVYTASQQNDDFGSLQNSVDVKIYQISATVGRGHPLSGTV